MSEDNGRFVGPAANFGLLMLRFHGLLERQTATGSTPAISALNEGKAIDTWATVPGNGGNRPSRSFVAMQHFGYLTDQDQERAPSSVGSLYDSAIPELDGG